MRKRIFYFMSFTILLSVSLVILLWRVGLHDQLGDELRDGLRSLRITLIEPDGKVAYDSLAGQHTLDRHEDRPEVRDALRQGYGESERYSDTLQATAFYYAVLTIDGKIIRLATTQSLSTIFDRLAPKIYLCLLFALLIALCSAKWLTGKIMAPIGALDVDSVHTGDHRHAYEELVPLVRKIETQQEAIVGQHTDMANQANMTRAITESMQEGLILVDGEGKVRMLNAGAAAIFGIHEVENKDVVYLCRHTDFHDALRSCLHGDNAEMTLEQNGRVYAAYMHPVLHPERGGGEVTGAVILLVDRTEQRRAEEQRRRFSADVSHELKTPLTTISALSEMLAADLVKQEDIRDFARKISGQSRRLINIINDIIRLSEFDEGKIDRSFRVFDLWELAHSVLVSLREKAESRKIRLELRGERLEMLASERMIDELLCNLVDNAIQYNVSGGEVVVFLALQGEHISISVTDTGIGIAAEHQDRVFERFYRVDHARSQGKGGTGLGLAIAKHIVEHHGGTISLDSGETGTSISCCFRACP